MLKKTIKFDDLDGNPVEDVFYFHLNKAELVEMEMGREGGLSETLQRIVEAEDAPALIREFKSIILGAYGKRSEDGRRFIKNQQLRDEFEASEAYSALFMELVTNTDAAIEFVNGVIPTGLSEDVAKITEAAATKQQEGVRVLPPQPANLITREEFLNTPPEELPELVKKLDRGEIILEG